ncbi:MAG: hypothetical protein M1840_008113 [Geoglossum simile]|nr:MAG: hypothetical protein M1840_008113 [Geoglossum simile]
MFAIFTAEGTFGFRIPSVRVQHLTVKERNIGILFNDSILLWNFDSQSSCDIALDTAKWDYRLILFPPFEDLIVVFSQSCTNSPPLIRFDKYTLDGRLLMSTSLEIPFQFHHWHTQPCDRNGSYVVASSQLPGPQTTNLIRFDYNKSQLFLDRILGRLGFYVLWKDILVSASRDNDLSIAELKTDRGSDYLRGPRTPEFSYISRISQGDTTQNEPSTDIYSLIGDEDFLILCRRDSFTVWCFLEEVVMYDEDVAFRETSMSMRSRRLEHKREETARLAVV